MMTMAFISAHLGEVAERFGEHCALCLVTLSSAVLLGIPIGIMCARHRHLAARALLASSTVMAVPSLALLGLLVILTGGIGLLPTLMAMIVYALVPIVQSTREAVAMSAPEHHRYGRWRWFPLPEILGIDLHRAMPMVISELRRAALWTIGSATLCAVIGGGGLGVFIIRGIASMDGTLVLMGAVPVVAMALATDWLFGRALAQSATTPPAG